MVLSPNIFTTTDLSFFFSAQQGLATKGSSSTDSDTGSRGTMTDMDAREEEKPIGEDSVGEEAESVEPIDDGKDP